MCVHTRKLFPPKEEINLCQGVSRVHPESLGSSRCRWQEAAQQTSEGPEVVSLVILLELAVDVGHPVQNQPPVSGPYQPHSTHGTPQARRGDPVSVFLAIFTCLLSSKIYMVNIVTFICI